MSLSKLDSGGAVSVYTGNVTFVVPDPSEMGTIGSVVKEYESVAGARINADRLVEL